MSKLTKLQLHATLDSLAARSWSLKDTGNNFDSDEAGVTFHRTAQVGSLDRMKVN